MFRISTRTHGVIDYAFGAAVAALPQVIECTPTARRLMRGAAAGAAAYSMSTNYERGVVKALLMHTHLALDAASGAGFIAAAALMRDERPQVRALLAGIGLFELVAAAMTSTEPYRDGRAPSPAEKVSHRLAEYAR